MVELAAMTPKIGQRAIEYAELLPPGERVVNLELREDLTSASIEIEIASRALGGFLPQRGTVRAEGETIDEADLRIRRMLGVRTDAG